MAIVNATDATFDREVFQADKPVLVDFWAPWCGPCQMMGPILDQIDSEGDDIKIVKLNGEEHRETLKKMGISAFPTFLMVRGGLVLSEQLGYSDKEKFVEWIAATLANPDAGITPEEYSEIAREKAKERLEASNSFRRVNALIGSGLKTLGGLVTVFSAAAYPPAVIGSVAAAFNAVRTGSLYHTEDGRLDPYKTTAGHIFSGITNFSNTAGGLLMIGLAASSAGIFLPLGIGVVGAYMLFSGTTGLHSDFKAAMMKVPGSAFAELEKENSRLAATATTEPEKKPEAAACEGSACPLPGPKNG